MFERILIPIDGSRLAEEMLERIRPLAEKARSAVLLLRVVDIPPSIASRHASLGVGEPALFSSIEKDATRYVEMRAKDLEIAGLRAKGIARIGSAAGTILDVARTERASLVAISTHGRSGVSRWVLGSVAERVVRHSDTPVLVAPSTARNGARAASGAEFAPKRILVPIDGSAASLRILPHVWELSRLFGSEVGVLFVHETFAGVAIDPEAGERAFSGAKPLVPDSVRVSYDESEGEPGGAILDSTKQGAHDMVAMTTHGRSGVSRWLLGSVAEKVVRGSAVPVLLVRASS